MENNFVVYRSTAPCSGLDSMNRPYGVAHIDDIAVMPNLEITADASTLAEATEKANAINATLGPECPQYD